MKKKRIAFLALAVLMSVSGCSGSTQNGDVDHKEEENMDTEKKLLTADELIRLAGISEEQYRDVDLEQFIKDFEITEDDIETLNIGLLLEEYSDTETEDVSDLLRGGITERTSDFTEGVSAVAFLENINTDNECVYYDLEERLMPTFSLICRRQRQRHMRRGSSWSTRLMSRGFSRGAVNRQKRRSLTVSTWSWQWRMMTEPYSESRQTGFFLSSFRILMRR